MRHFLKDFLLLHVRTISTSPTGVSKNRDEEIKILFAHNSNKNKSIQFLVDLENIIRKIIILIDRENNNDPSNLFTR